MYTEILTCTKRQVHCIVIYIVCTIRMGVPQLPHYTFSILDKIVFSADTVFCKIQLFFVHVRY